MVGSLEKAHFPSWFGFPAVRFEPGTAGNRARGLPLCYAVPQEFTLRSYHGEKPLERIRRADASKSIGCRFESCQLLYLSLLFSLPTRLWNFLNEAYREMKKLKLNEYQDVLHDADLAQK